MQDAFYIETVDQAQHLLKPERIELLKQLDRPRTCPELAEIFEQSPQRIYYHVKALEKAGLVEKVEEKRVRGVVEGHYQARARTYWFTPKLVGQVGSSNQVQDQASLRFLLSLAEEVHEDIGRLGHQSEIGQDVPSLGLSAHIYLPDGSRRADFLADVQTFFTELAQKYGLPDNQESDELGGKSFRIVLACYPKEAESPSQIR
ncbi:helix-turn-helix domain-containing protein [Chloroflexi bacterium TSY]|nr:helix-turn-helix domain-containing protein [Chloroflexi bacterium TSY]